MTPQLTPAEVVATKLFGWERLLDQCPTTWHSARHFSDGKPYVSLTRGFPDFTTDVCKWYWIRQLEDALTERGLGKAYAKALVARFDFIDDTFDAVVVPCLRATVEQRLAAAVRVLEEAGV